MGQSQVFIDTAPGVPGSKASLNPFTYHPNNLIASAPVAVGLFAWAGTDPTTGSNAGTGAPIGIIERNLVYPDYNVTDEGTLVIPGGAAFATVVRGDLWVTSLTAATVGQKVFAVSADGTIKTGAAGATITGAVETQFSVVTAGAIGAPIIVSA
jgi:hypothetical protein